MRIEACVESQIQSGSLAGTERPPEGAGAVSYMELPRHWWISAWPSQKEKTEPLPWAVVGKSIHLEISALPARAPSLIIQGLSSTIRKICEPLARVKSDVSPKVA